MNKQSKILFARNIRNSIQEKKIINGVLIMYKKKDNKEEIKINYEIKCPKGYDIFINISNDTFDFTYTFIVQVTNNFNCDLVIDSNNFTNNNYIKFIQMNDRILRFFRSGNDMFLFFNAFMKHYYGKNNYIELSKKYYRQFDSSEDTFGIWNYVFRKKSCATEYGRREIVDFKKLKNIIVITKLISVIVFDIIDEIK
jgi:hypothetical protein